MKLSDLMQATFKNVGEELGLNISVVNALSECCTFADGNEKTIFSGY